MTFVAISRVMFPAALKNQMHEVGLAIVSLAKKQKGFVSIAFHQNNDANQTMMYWEWESEADHQACMQSSDWSSLMLKHAALFETEGVEFSIDRYEKLG